MQVIKKIRVLLLFIILTLSIVTPVIASTYYVSNVGSTGLINLNYSDATQLETGYIYGSSRFSIGGTMYAAQKISTNLMAVTDTYTNASFKGNINSMALTTNYVWIGEWQSEGDGLSYLYQLNKSDLTYVAKYSINDFHNIYACCTDGTYIYCLCNIQGGQLYTGKILATAPYTLTNSSMAVAITGTPHAIVYSASDGYIYTAVNAGAGTTCNILKIDYSTDNPSIVDSTTLAGVTVTDDSLDDGTYYYVFGERDTNKGKVYKIKKSDLTYTTLVVNTSGIDGACFLNGSSGAILAGEEDTSDALNYKVYLINASFDASDGFLLDGKNAAVPSVQDIMVDATYVYVLVEKNAFEGQGMVLRYEIDDFINPSSPTPTPTSTSSSDSLTGLNTVVLIVLIAMVIFFVIALMSGEITVATLIIAVVLIYMLYSFLPGLQNTINSLLGG